MWNKSYASSCFLSGVEKTVAYIFDFLEVLNQQLEEPQIDTFIRKVLDIFVELRVVTEIF